MDSIPQRRCAKCGETKPATPEYFARSSNCKYGIEYTCKSCKKAYREANKEHINDVTRAWQEEHREYAREQSRIWRENNRERDRANARDWQRKHPELSKSRQGKWREENLERWNELARNWKNTHPETRNVSAHKRRAYIENLPVEFNTQLWRQCLAYWDNRCAICGRQPDEYFTLAKDHWIAVKDPRANNPGTVAWNMLPLCHAKVGGRNACNNSKNSHDPVAWLYSRLDKHEAEIKLDEITLYFSQMKGKCK